MIPFHDFGGQGPVLHFAHANGYPPGCYHRFLEQLTGQFHIIAIHHRPMWGPPPRNGLWNWHGIADDMIRFLDEQGHKQIVGVGHSLGAAATVIAAAKRPDLFKKLLLLEPIVLPEMMDYMRYIPWFLRKQIPVVKMALGRRDQWETSQQAFQHYRTKQVFRGFSDDVLQDFVKHATHETPEGKITLTYSKQWEAFIYSCATSIWKSLQKLELPILAIRGARSEYLTKETWSKWQKLQPQIHFEEIQRTGHLLPMEIPQGLARMTQPFLMG